MTLRLAGLSLGRASPPRGPRRGGPGGGWLPERPKGPPPIDWARVADAVHKRAKDFDYLTPEHVRNVAGFLDWVNQADELLWSAGTNDSIREAKARGHQGDVVNLRMPRAPSVSITDDPTALLVGYVANVPGGIRRELISYFGKPE